MGWPASVREERIQDVMWFRVYLLPPGVRADSVRAVSGFEMVVDMSDTDDAEKKKPSCSGFDRISARIELLLKINAAVPDRPYLAALRVVGHDWPNTIEDVKRSIRNSVRRMTDDRPPARSRLYWGMLAYDRTGFAKAVYQIKPFPRRDPMEEAVSAGDQDLSAVPGRKIMIVVSDFKNMDASEIHWDNQPYPCVYTVAFDADEKGRAAAVGLAQSTGCGNSYDGCRLLADTSYFQSFITDVFGDSATARSMQTAASGCTGPDRDEDGVCDDIDVCPNTPKGALVDERGCWMAALGPFFEFDRADVRPEFMPGLEWAADILQSQPDLMVEVAGHTDDIGSEAYNQNLGLRRALAVKDVLVRMNVDSARLKTKSYGERRPIADNATDTGRARNRRVELHVLHVDQKQNVF